MLDFAVNVRADRSADVAARPARRPTERPRSLPERRRTSSAPPRPSRPGTAAPPTRSRCSPAAPRASRCCRSCGPRLAALIAPSFTEPEVALRRGGHPDSARRARPAVPAGRRRRARRRRPGRGRQPDEPDVGPARPRRGPRAAPTRSDRGRRRGVRRRHRRRSASRWPDQALPDVVVLRSLTKTWSLAGLRVGYALGAPDVLARLTAARPHWPLGTLQLEAIAACSDAARQSQQAAAGARELAALRTEMVAGLTAAGAEVVDGRAPFVLFAVPDAELVRKTSGRQGYRRSTVRHVRRAGRAVPAGGGAAGMADPGRRDRGGDAVSARLADVIDVLDDAYPPALAADWDSVGLVCGDPNERVDVGHDRRRRDRRRRRRGARRAVCCWPTTRCCCAVSTPSRRTPPRARCCTG